MMVLTIVFLLIGIWNPAYAGSAAPDTITSYYQEGSEHSVIDEDALHTATLRSDDTDRFPGLTGITELPDGSGLDLGELPKYDNGGEVPWHDATPDLAEMGLTSRTPPANRPVSRAGRDSVGDVERFWAINYNNGRWIQYTATCRSVGDHSFIYVENGATYTQAKVDWLENQFNKTIYPTDTAVFGPEPDVDGIHQITIVLYRMDGSGGTGGYFTSINEVNNPNDPWYPYSNHREMFYIDTADLNSWGQHIAAHEFQHTIHFNGDWNENSWVNEGCADLAILKCYGLVSAVSGHVNSFRNNHDTDLTVWNQQNRDYGKSVAFIDYLEEHYGGEAMIKDLVAEDLNSILGINRVLAAHGYQETFTDVFKNWTVANKLDDPAVAGGIYNYANISLRIPDTGRYNYTHYPLGRTNRNVGHWAADYYRFSDGIGMLEFSFNGNDGADFALMAIKEGPGGKTVEELRLDSNQDGDFGILGFGSTYTDIVIVVACISSGTGTVSYSFSADTSNRPVIIHTPIEDNNNIDGPHEISATIVDPDNNLNVSSTKLYYNKNGTSQFTEASLNLVAADTYSINIPGPSNNVTIFYYLSAKDDDENTTTHPFEADPLDNSTVHSFIVVPDVTPPAIQHEPLEDTVYNGPYEVTCTVVDDWFLDLDSVTLHYNFTSSPNMEQIIMTRTVEPDEYRVHIPQVSTNDTVHYFLTAQDRYMVPNTARLPANGFYSFNVFEPATVLFVDDDDAGNHTSFDTYYKRALNYTGIDYDVLNVPYLENGPNITILARYRAVVWETGDEWGNYISEPESGTTLTTSDVANIIAYLETGGNLFLSGSFIGLELWHNIFFTSYLNIQYKGSNNYTGFQLILGEEDNRVGNGLIFDLTNRTSDSKQRYMCNYSVVNDGAEVLFSSPEKNCNVGFQTVGEDYRAAYLSFPYEEIADDNTRNLIMARILEYLLPSISLSHIPLENTVEVAKPYVVTMSADSEEAVEYARIVYSTDGTNRNTVPMVYNASSGEYFGSIPPQSENATINYYVMAENRIKCRAFHPDDLSLVDLDTWHNFTVFANDLEPPTLVHEPKYDVLYVDNYTFFATAWDNVAIDPALFTLEYTFDEEGAEDSLNIARFTSVHTDIYTTAVEGPPGLIFYRIGISDIVGNRITFPAEGYYEMDIFFHDNIEIGADNWSFPGSQNIWEISGTDDTTFSPLSLSGVTFPNRHFISTGANSNYTAGVDARIISPEIDLTRAEEPELIFYMWVNLTAYDGDGIIDSEFDRVYLEIQNKTGYSTAAVYDHTTLPGENEWLRYKVDLDEYSGQVIRLSWRIADTDQSAQARGAALDFIKITGDFVNSPPEMDSFSLSPGWGFNSTTFTFNVTYLDDDDDMPDQILLVVDNTSFFTMSAAEEWDDQPMDGKNYTVKVHLPVGNHSYHFIGRNPYDTVVSSIFTGPTVYMPNSAPIFHVPDMEVIAGHELTYVESAVDPDNDTLAYYDNSTLIDIDHETGTFTLIPSLDQVGVHRVWIMVTDGFFEIWVSFKIVVLDNLAPIFTEQGDITANAGESVSLTISAVDPENETITFFSITTLFRIDPETGEINFTPLRKDAGKHPITIRVTDGFTEPREMSFSITVLWFNKEPLLLNMSVSPAEGNETTTFFFTVVYVDGDNDVPEYVRIYIDETPHDMEVPGDGSDMIEAGVLYRWNTTLRQGKHNYYFECRDSSGSDNDLFRSETRFITVKDSESEEKEEKEEEDKNIFEEYSQWVILGFALIILIIVLIMVFLSRRKRRKQDNMEKHDKLSDTMNCPICKAVIGKYETVCPACDYRITRRRNIYEKKEDRSTMMNCPGCLSKVNKNEVKCPYCKVRLPGAKRGKRAEPVSGISEESLEEETTIRYKRPGKGKGKVARERKGEPKLRTVKKKEEPDDAGGEIELVFKRPDDYQEGMEEDDDSFERELAKIVGDEVVESEEEADIMDSYAKWKAERGEKGTDEEDEEQTSYSESTPGPGDGEVWDDEEGPYAEIVSEDVWEDTEEEEYEDNEGGDGGSKSFQWLDQDAMDGSVGDGQSAGEDIWDDDEDEYEIKDSFVPVDDGQDEDKKYADVEFRKYESYEEAGEDVATWDEDDADEYFEVLEETRDEKKKKKMGRSKQRRRKKKERVKFITDDEDQYLEAWGD